MRTLLNEALPPYSNEAPAFSEPQIIQKSRRIFSENAVLTSNDPDLMEVGVDRAVIATPGVCADLANNAPERGLTTLQAEAEQVTESPAL